MFLDLGVEMEYSLNAGEWNKVFAVPSSVVDKYIKIASGNSLKLLLYLMRHGGEYFTAEVLRAELGFEEIGELEDAVQFWVQRGIIRTKSTKNAVVANAVAEQDGDLQIALPDIPAKEDKKPVRKAKPAVLSNGSIAESINSSPEVKMLVDESEKMFGRLLKNSERQTIVQLVEHYGLPCDVALMLVGYCFKVGKAAPAYISKVAEDWANEGIMTVQLADEKISNLEKQSGIENRICEKLGLQNITQSNREYIKTWAADWQFGEEMIMLAYQKTVDSIGKWTFPYANKVLENWKLNGVLTPAQAKKFDEEFKNPTGRNNYKQAKKPVIKDEDKKSSFDVDKVMSRVMKNYKK